MTKRQKRTVSSAIYLVIYYLSYFISWAYTNVFIKATNPTLFLKCYSITILNRIIHCFFHRYYYLAFRAHQMPETSKENAVAILQRAKLEDWVLGKTKVMCLEQESERVKISVFVDHIHLSTFLTFYLWSGVFVKHKESIQLYKQKAV